MIYQVNAICPGNAMSKDAMTKISVLCVSVHDKVNIIIVCMS